MLVKQSAWLLAAASSLLLSSSNAQTITVDGKTVGTPHSHLPPRVDHVALVSFSLGTAPKTPTLNK